jgi:release factor glutamine methyltransferase
MTVLEVLNAATDYLRKQGIESPRLNAEHLLAHVLAKKNRIELYLEFERTLGESERAPLRDLVRRRSEGLPLQHLLGTVDFLGFIFATDGRALLSRARRPSSSSSSFSRRGRLTASWTSAPAAGSSR